MICSRLRCFREVHPLLWEDLRPLCHPRLLHYWPAHCTPLCAVSHSPHRSDRYSSSQLFRKLHLRAKRKKVLMMLPPTLRQAHQRPPLPSSHLLAVSSAPLGVSNYPHPSTSQRCHITRWRALLWRSLPSFSSTARWRLQGRLPAGQGWSLFRQRGLTSRRCRHAPPQAAPHASPPSLRTTLPSSGAPVPPLLLLLSW